MTLVSFLCMHIEYIINIYHYIIIIGIFLFLELDSNLFYYDRGKGQDLYSFQILVKLLKTGRNISLCIRNKTDPTLVLAELLTRFTLNSLPKMLTQNTCDKQKRCASLILYSKLNICYLLEHGECYL